MVENKADKRSVVFAEEALVVDVQAFLHRLMLEKGMSRAQLADAMGVTKARVSQIFSDECKNLTVRLLARAVYALGEEVEITTGSCRRLTESEDQEDRRAIIAASPNVTSLWQSDNEEEERRLEDVGIVSCPPGDPRLDAALSSLARDPRPLRMANA